MSSSNSTNDADRPIDLDLDNLPPFPGRLNEKLKEIRERLKLTPDQFAPLVGVASGEAIECYERELGDELRPLLVTTLWRYVKVAGVPIENLWSDDRDLWFGHRVN